MTVETKSVSNRREVHYENYESLLADAERLESGQVQMLGNWSYGQVLGHIANALNASIDGFPGRLPWFIQIFARMFMRRLLLNGPLRPGFKLPKEAEDVMVPNEEKGSSSSCRTAHEFCSAC